MSKLFWGGLRVGWIRGPEPLIQKLARRKALADLGSSLPSQALAARLLVDTERVVAERRQEAAAGLAQLTTALERRLPSWRFTRPAGGLTLWVRLPRGNATEFLALAQRHGVTFVPGPLASPGDAHTDHLRLTFVLPPRAIEEGVERLARAFAAYAPAAEKRLAAVEVLV
jgi:DNA-binding transcriptional MocR family regulator